MNIHQLPTAERTSIQLQETQLQMLLPLNNPMLHPPVVAHVMPTPTTNWSMESMPWKITKSDHGGDVMEFTAHAPHNNTAMRRALLHQKRKSEFNATGTLPVKQFVSEEMITAHFNGLHISSDYIQHHASNISDGNGDELPSTSGKCFSNLTYEDYQITAKELGEKLLNINRITMCEELKKFNNEQKKASYLPEALLHRIYKPCTALVLWQPPPIMHVFSENNVNNKGSDVKSETIDDYSISDVGLPPRQADKIDDFIDNNNSCNLDLNSVKPDSMDEDL